MKTNNKIKIKIKINGKNISVEEYLKVSSLVKKLDISLNKVAIELNNKIIDKKKIEKYYFKK